MALLQSCLVLHEIADSLNWCEVAQITLLCESGGKSTLIPIKQLRVGDLVFQVLPSDIAGDGLRLHDTLSEDTNLSGLVPPLVGAWVIVHLVDVVEGLPFNPGVGMALLTRHVAPLALRGWFLG